MTREIERERGKFFYRFPNHIKLTRRYFATLAMPKLTFMRIYEKIRLGDHSTFKVTAAFHANIRNWLPTPRTFNWFQPFRLRFDGFSSSFGRKSASKIISPTCHQRFVLATRYRLIRFSCKEHARACTRDVTALINAAMPIIRVCT